MIMRIDGARIDGRQRPETKIKSLRDEDRKVKEVDVYTVPLTVRITQQQTVSVWAREPGES